MKRLLLFIILLLIPMIILANKNETEPVKPVKKPPPIIKETKVKGKILKYEYLTNSVILVQTEERIYLSVNKGDTWNLLNDKICRGEVKCVDHYKLSPVDRKQIYFRGTLDGGEGWIVPDITEDKQEFEQMEMPKDRLQASLLHFEFHHTDKARGLLIVKDKRDEHTALYQTFNSGKSWKFVADHIKIAYWATNKAPHYNPDRIMAIQKIHHPNAAIHDGRFVTIDVGGGYVNIVDRGIHHAQTLFTENKFFFVATKDRQANMIQLHVTADNGRRIRLALTPYNIPQSHYSILDTREGEVFLNIRQQRQNEKAWGHVYHSDPSGARYSSSLNYNRISGNSVDFHRVRSLDGVFIANIVLNSDDEKCKSCKGYVECHENCRFGTRVSFDKGTTWNPLRTVPGSSKCNEEGLLENGSCEVHLHGFASHKRTPIMSQKDAVGIIIASGNEGGSLRTDDSSSTTYLSRDGGQTWDPIDVGNHIYAMTDHGGIIIIGESGATTSFKYSYDQGKTWADFELTKKGDTRKFIIHHFLHSDNQLAKKFILAVEDESNNEHYLIQIDFANLHERDCKPPSSSKVGSPESDYEYWMPVTYTGEKCLLGRRIRYVRRKSHVQCFNTIPFEKPHDVHHCPCSYADYQCDYGYSDSVGAGGRLLCSRADEFVSRPPADCSGYYNESRGYVRIAGDSCIANAISAQLDPIEKKCLPMVSITSILVIFSFFTLIVALCLSICYNNSPTFRSCLRSFRRRSSKNYATIPSNLHDSDSEGSDLGIMMSDDEAASEQEDQTIDETQYANQEASSSNITIVKKDEIPLTAPSSSAPSGDDAIYEDDDFEDSEFVKAS